LACITYGIMHISGDLEQSVPYKHILYITTAKREAIKEKKIRYPLNPPQKMKISEANNQKSLQTPTKNRLCVVCIKGRRHKTCLPDKRSPPGHTPIPKQN
jgi:hypothetical protein